jgi:cytidylate kinase
MDDFKTMKEITEKVFKTPEDEEFERIMIEMEQRDAQGWRKRQVEALKTAEEAFAAWEGVKHEPNQHDVQKQAFKAGWDAAMKSRWSEKND